MYVYDHRSRWWMQCENKIHWELRQKSMSSRKKEGKWPGSSIEELKAIPSSCSIITKDAEENVCYVRLERKQHHQGSSEFQCEQQHKGNIQAMRFKIQNFARDGSWFLHGKSLGVERVGEQVRLWLKIGSWRMAWCTSVGVCKLFWTMPGFKSLLCKCWILLIFWWFLWTEI